MSIWRLSEKQLAYPRLTHCLCCAELSLFWSADCADTLHPTIACKLVPGQAGQLRLFQDMLCMIRCSLDTGA